MVRLRTVGFAAVVCLLVPAAVLAARIVGTGKSDVLKGTPKGDMISGYAGHDRLLGYAGNDVLNGGPGNDVLVGGAGADVLNGGPGNDVLVGAASADRLLCGAGKDRATADSKDDVAKDCEQVTGLPKPTPRPSPPQPPPPPPPLPPTGPAQAGSYAGTTSQGSPASLVVSAAGTNVEGLRFGLTTTTGACSQSGSVFERVTVRGIGPLTATVAVDGTFSIASTEETSLVAGASRSWEDQGGPTPSGRRRGSVRAVREISATGRFAGPSLQGTLRIVFSFVYQGVPQRCTGDYTWNASKTG